jgi:hypothetical protein
MSIKRPSTSQDAIKLLARLAHYDSASDMGRKHGIDPRTMRRWVKHSKDILSDDYEQNFKRQPLQGVKILHYDVEVYKAWLNREFVYELKQSERYIKYKNIDKDKSLMCFAYAWQHEKKVKLCSVLDNTERFINDHYDDYELCLKLKELFEEADIVVAYNGDRFDWKFFQWRCAVNGITAPRKPIMFDPFKVVKSEFLPTARGLGDVALALGLSMKAYMPDQNKCASGCALTIGKTGEYCKDDIPPMIDIFEFLLFNGYIRKGLKINSILGNNDLCISCGMDEFVDDGYDYTPKSRYELKKCVTCNTSQRGAKV